MKSKLVITILTFLLFSFSTFLSKKSFSQSTKDYVDSYSTNSLLVLMKNGDSILGNATAFTVRVKNSIYLITNNHVVGGEFHAMDFERKYKRRPLSNEVPDTIYVRMYKKKLYEYYYEKIPINKKGALGYIKFYSNEMQPNNQNLLDLIAIKLPEIDTGTTEIRPYTINDFNANLSTYNASELFVIGFPLNYGLNSVYPLWKRGTIASDPIFDEFYIDATTRFGMSGSPVVYRSNNYTTRNGGFAAGSIYTFIVGIYCAQNPETEIGVVTKVDFVFNKLNKIAE